MRKTQKSERRTNGIVLSLSDRKHCLEYFQENVAGVLSLLGSPTCLQMKVMCIYKSIITIVIQNVFATVC